MRARGDTRSLRDTITRAEQADKEYKKALKALEEKSHENHKVHKKVAAKQNVS